MRNVECVSAGSISNHVVESLLKPTLAKLIVTVEIVSISVILK